MVLLGSCASPLPVLRAKGGPRTTTTRQSALAALGVARRNGRLVTAVALGASLFVIFPLSLARFLDTFHYYGPGEAHSLAWTISTRVGVLVGVVGLCAFGRDCAASRHNARIACSREALKRQSFKCITPQIPGLFVVFPVRVVRRGVAHARVVAVDDDAVRVELDTDADAGVDSEAALRTFLEEALAPGLVAPSSSSGASSSGASSSTATEKNDTAASASFEIVTFVGKKDAGPTSLAAGVAMSPTVSTTATTHPQQRHHKAGGGGDPALAARVGKRLMDLARNGGRSSSPLLVHALARGVL
mmetsp:Transcript_2984/g.11355  ORF Transcript_2984/g.11355 Transcript_2984/m.11355 type:complete len:302 (-) Transcript_2984:265-1170(-)